MEVLKRGNMAPILITPKTIKEIKDGGEQG